MKLLNSCSHKAVLIYPGDSRDELYQFIDDYPGCTLDLETKGLNYCRDDIIGTALAFRNGSDPEDNAYFYVMADKSQDRELYERIFQPEKKIVMHNMNFDMKMIEHFIDPTHNTMLRGEAHDTMVMAWCVNENYLKIPGVGLKSLARYFLGYDSTKESKELSAQLRKYRLKKCDMYRLPVEITAIYATADVRMTLQLCDLFFQKLRENDSWDFYYSEMLRYTYLLRRIEHRGFHIDIEKLRLFEYQAEKDIEEALRKIKVRFGRNFNPGSPKQVCQALGLESSAHDVLEGLEGSSEDVSFILDYREAQKYYSTFYKGISDNMVQENGEYVLHPSLAVKTVSGRLASTSPNILAMPKKPGRYNPRDILIAKPGHVLIAVDYSQAELRLMAHYCQDPVLMRAYTNHEDLHQLTADICGISRAVAKTINFGILYGMGAGRLAAKLGVPEQEAGDYLEKYNARIPGMRDFSRSMQSLAERQGYITLWTGQKRHFDNSTSFSRDALNGLIQGGISCLVRRKMLEISQKVPEAEMLLQVHDEIIFQTPDKGFCELVRIVDEIVGIMEDTDFRVPFEAEPKIGLSWGSMVSLSDILNSPEVQLS